MLKKLSFKNNPQEEIGRDPTGTDIWGDTLDPPATGIYPMVAVANPRFGLLVGPEGQEEQDACPTIHIFCPRSQIDRQNFLKDVPPLNEGFIPWRDAVEMIRRQWYLNSHEMLQVVQGLKIRTVRGDYTGSNAGGAPYSPGSTELNNALANLYERIRERLAARADYGKIGEVKQKEAETASDFLDRLHPVFRQHSGLTYEVPETPYQQQLKNAFLNGLLPPVKSHVEKHWVTMNIGSLPDALQYAEHALRVIKKKHENVGTFTVDPETGFIAFSGEYRGQMQGRRRGNRGRGRGGYKGRGNNRSERYDRDRDNTCWQCGKEGHFSRDCRSGKNREGRNED